MNGKKGERKDDDDDDDDNWNLSLGDTTAATAAAADVGGQKERVSDVCVAYTVGVEV